MEEVKKEPKGKKIWKIVLNVLLGIIFTVSILMAITTLNTTEGIPNLFGLGYLTVQSDSMEPVFYEGDLIFVTTTNSNSVFEEGDIITFHTVIQGVKVLNTHEVITYTEISGVRYYYTKGANVGEADLSTVTAGDIVAKYTGARLAGFGKVMDFVQSSTGFLITIVLPLAALFIYQIINFSLLMASFKKDQALAVAGKVDFNTLDEAQKAEIAKAYLESLNAKKEEVAVQEEAAKDGEEEKKE